MDDTLVYIVGMAGNLLFGIKSLPQVVSCYKRKSMSGVSPGMLLLDFGGNILCASFIFLTTGFKLWPQFVNYFCATILLVTLFIMMLVYRYRCKKWLYIISIIS